jgi:hypothetical protein
LIPGLAGEDFGAVPPTEPLLLIPPLDGAAVVTGALLVGALELLKVVVPVALSLGALPCWPLLEQLMEMAAKASRTQKARVLRTEFCLPR